MFFILSLIRILLCVRTVTERTGEAYNLESVYPFIQSPHGTKCASERLLSL